MKKPLLLLTALLLLAACGKQNVRRTEDFNFDWRFTLGDDPAYASPGYDDSSWRGLRLPHDWAIEGEFSKDNPSTPGGGALPGGIGWYRKHFAAPTDGRRVTLEFDGVFMNSTVWVNGQQAGHRPYGYSSFSYDITPYLAASGDNVVAVRCDNSLQPNSRWYAGCGIYRNVRLVVTSPLHVAYSGTCVTTPEVADDRASVRVATTVEGPAPAQFELRQRIFDPRGREIASRTDAYALPENGQAEFVQTLEVPSPLRWSPETPHRYWLRTEIVADGKTVDDYATTFGIRTFAFTPDRGMILNGKPTKLLGVCMHHDLGALGTAVHRRALERQLEILRGMGCNAIRTSHNPPAPELLDLCDSMGFLVMDEAMDMWRRRKTAYDYARYFDEWHERDIEDFIRRDRNHPSIVMWSVGNEILEQWDNAELDAELTAEEANVAINFLKERTQGPSGERNPSVLLTRHLVGLIKALDPTRPVTTGCNEPRPTNNLLRSGAIDIVGFNYANNCYDSVPAWYPGKPFIGSETASSIQSRGFYLNPSDREQVHPEPGRSVSTAAHHQCSAYDHSRVPWGVTHERAWIDVRDRDYAAGTFVWTGFDYLGEPTPYTWPSRSSYFGIVDLCGFPKDVYYMYRSEWSDQPTLHLFPHWNWNEGDKIDLWVYYNDADEIELTVNGRSLGRQAKTAHRLHCVWKQVPFEPGEITAIAYRDGRETARVSRRTAGPVAAVCLTADRARIAADGYDLSFVTVDAVDAAGNFMPTAMDDLRFSVEGAGELVGVDNGNAAGHQCLKGDRMRLFHGKALAVVRSFRGRKGAIVLRVAGDGIPESSIRLEAR